MDCKFVALKLCGKMSYINTKPVSQLATGLQQEIAINIQQQRKEEYEQIQSLLAPFNILGYLSPPRKHQPIFGWISMHFIPSSSISIPFAVGFYSFYFIVIWMHTPHAQKFYISSTEAIRWNETREVSSI